MEAAQAKFVERLKEFRAINGMSYEMIAERTEKIGETVSVSTIKRIFAISTENVNVKWKTLLSVGKAMIGEEALKEYTPVRAEEYYAQTEALLADIAVRQKEKEMLEQMLDDGKGLCEERAETIKSLRKQVKYQRIISVALLACLVLFIVTVLVVDLCDPGVGFFFFK